MKKEELLFGPQPCVVYSGTEPPHWLIIQPADATDLSLMDQEVALLEEGLTEPFTLVAVKVSKWNDELTPWPAPPVFGKRPFGGDAESTLRLIEQHILPQFAGCKAVIAGYSLAGFFSLWTAYNSQSFAAAVAASPSVWYPQWMPWAESHSPECGRIYLSLGNREAHTRTEIMKQVDRQVARQYELLLQAGVETTLVWNVGNHFQDSEQRTAMGIIWAIEKLTVGHMSCFSSTLLRWYEAHGRDLPWRHTRDPYAIWLSEVILQQTRIFQGRDYWLCFMRELPTVEALAAASEDQVLRLWQGLGYYSRARNLHAAARQVVAMGRFPRTAQGLRQLKGVGQYTAAAVASSAFDEPVAAVDGNVLRVVARHWGIDTPIDSTAGRQEISALAQQLLPPAHAARFNQAMMDFGALCCTPRSPHCAECPVAVTCVALREHRVEQLPVKGHRTAVVTRRMALVWMRCRGQVALMRRQAGDIWQGLWQPPLWEPPEAMPRLDGTLTLLRSGVKHLLTHRIILADFYLLECDQRPPLPSGYLWLPEIQVDRYAKPRLVQKLLESLPPEK